MAVVRFLVKDLPFGSESIFGPGLLKVDEGGLSGAEEEVLQGRERQELVFGEHGGDFGRG